MTVDANADTHATDGCAVCARPVRAPLRTLCCRCALDGYRANQREARHAARSARDFDDLT